MDGVIWNRGEMAKSSGDWGGIVSSPLKKPVLEGYKYPDPNWKERFSNLNKKDLLDVLRLKVLIRFYNLNVNHRIVFFI